MQAQSELPSAFPEALASGWLQGLRLWVRVGLVLMAPCRAGAGCLGAVWAPAMPTLEGLEDAKPAWLRFAVPTADMRLLPVPQFPPLNVRGLGQLAPEAPFQPHRGRTLEWACRCPVVAVGSSVVGKRCQGVVSGHVQAGSASLGRALASGVLVGRTCWEQAVTDRRSGGGQPAEECPFPKWSSPGTSPMPYPPPRAPLSRLDLGENGYTHTYLGDKLHI